MIGAPGLDAPVALRLRLADLYAAYDQALDEGRYQDWPPLFAKRCIYRITARENFDAGLPVAMVFCESRGMLADRVAALRETTLYAPRLVRRLMGAPVLIAIDADGMRLAQSFALFETILNEPTAMFLCGRCYDRVIEDGGRLLFAERTVVADATNIPTSLVFSI